MIPQSSRERPHGTLAVSAKLIKPKKYQPKHYPPKPAGRSCRLVSEIDEKKRKKIQSYLASQIVGEETFACAKFRPQKDDLIFRRRGETVCEWRIRQQDIINFLCEDWLGDKKRGETKRRGPAAAFGAASKAKLDGTFLTEVKAALDHRQAMWEAHQQRCGCQEKYKVSEQTLKKFF